MKERLTIHVTGPFTVFTPDGAPLGGLSRRGQALLAFLSLSPNHRAERARLSDLLWSDRSEEQARASLRQELSVLRRQLPLPCLGTDRQQVWLDPGLIEVVRIPGDVLEGFDLRSEGFEDWLRQQRSSEAPAASPPTPSRSGRPVLAVLPFEGREGREGIFADGIVEEITGALSRVDEFDVIARQSAFSLEPHIDPRTAAERLRADYLVEGSVRRAGDRVRIAIQLVNGESGLTLWSEKFDDLLDDLFDLQDRIAGKVAGQLSPRLRAVEIDRAARCSARTSSAYEIKLTALPHFWAHRKEANARALAILDRALVRDPDYVPAIAYKAWALSQQPSYMWSDDPERDHAEALRLASSAAGRAGDHAPTLVALSAAFALSSEDTELALSYARRALDIDPNNAWGWMRLGWAQHYLQPNEQAIEYFDKAIQLSPLDPFRFAFHIGKSATWRQMGEYDRSLAELDEGFRINPGIQWALRLYVGTYMLAGRTEDAHNAAKRFKDAYPHVTLDYLRRCLPQAVTLHHSDYLATFGEVFREAGMADA